MKTLKLISPSINLENEYKEMLEEWHDSGEELVPFILRYDPKNFKKFVEQMEGFKNGIDIPETFVPHSTFWLVNSEDKILGVVNIRHKLNDKLNLIGGHIGYGVRPSQRRKGYATKILELALEESKKLGIKKALVTCNKNNIASKKTILKNNGIFYQEKEVEGVSVLSFWIDIN
ncbi:MAG TPA: GNAT family N-acetyltransferase [Ignavibacteria bacterium]|nr:GNAT family N-acetyltransferase [Ignavibacteria bacterium]